MCIILSVAIIVMFCSYYWWQKKYSTNYGSWKEKGPTVAELTTVECPKEANRVYATCSKVRAHTYSICPCLSIRLSCLFARLFRLPFGFGTSEPSFFRRRNLFLDVGPLPWLPLLAASAKSIISSYCTTVFIWYCDYPRDKAKWSQDPIIVARR